MNTKTIIFAVAATILVAAFAYGSTEKRTVMDEYYEACTDSKPEGYCACMTDRSLGRYFSIEYAPILNEIRLPRSDAEFAEIARRAHRICALQS